MDFIRFWLNNARYRSLPQSIFPSLVAVCFAAKSREFSLLFGLLSIIGVIIAHLGVNLFDDYFDYRAFGNVVRNNMGEYGFRTTKCHYIISGMINLNQLLIASIVLCVLALIIGLIICSFRGYFILYLVLITAILSIFYSAPPFQLSYHALGEVVVGLVFGPLLMMGVYYASCKKIDFSLVFISIPIGLLVTTIVYVHSIMDYEPDKKTKKLTLVGFLKKKN
ncbi:MAG: prenyltransferase [Bacteroidales bacterium OttesenSCG-928-I14]|jgi:1,4-dihydroxy-2-naphthoate octaprenyltransferase|nr:prenyltransferase [Bacteroidales bacterium OttesenSCG-928-I14]